MSDSRPRRKRLRGAAIAAFLVCGFAGLAPAAEPIDFKKMGAEGLEHLRAILRLDTSNPPGNEARVTAYLAEQLKAAGLEPRLFESAPSRGSLMVRLKGTGGGKPLLIMSHIDVVPVEKDLWSVPPFDAVIRDGFLWGRGTLDDKGMAAAELTTILTLARNRMRLARDVVFLAEADEEAGGTYGMDWLLEHHPDLFDAELVLNEGGRVIWSGGKVQYVAIQTSEKIYQDFNVIARGVAGHSSIPTSENPVSRLAAALGRIAAIDFPARLNAQTREFFRGIASTLPGEMAGCVPKLEDSRAALRCAEILSRNPNFNAMLRTTCTPTILKAGYKENVIPAEARANLNCRLLPGTDVKAFTEELRKAVSDPKVEVVPAREFNPPAGPSTTDTPLYAAIRKVAGQMAPGAPVVPYMSPGGTDSQVLRQRGMVAYGVLPFPIQEEDLRTMHANDEKISLEAFTWGNEMLYRVVAETAR
ncbi:MAG TPA: M20/M25/M40 family metallo-hydrolase [Candidatus Polarisedimenticolia bacterium]|jgi:acetylornithine deacetylase/succinyl-diaminopimelate desuccinylase-like protein|nr:M20/M25/M40 family metallo-hydrolase [Candidatus Polarisedimenticolia bacterium]